MNLVQRPWKLYVDSDGVVADFEYALLDHYGLEVRRIPKDSYWDAINDYDAKGGEWFNDLPLMPDAMQLWDAIKHLNPTFLTATGRAEETAATQKRVYLMRKFGVTDDRIITVRKSEHKAQFASPNAVLIDDNFERSIKSWEEAGGIGVHHLGTHMTLLHLKNLGII